jgi:hypothetical protein
MLLDFHHFSVFRPRAVRIVQINSHQAEQQFYSVSLARLNWSITVLSQFRPVFNVTGGFFVHFTH